MSIVTWIASVLQRGLVVVEHLLLALLLLDLRVLVLRRLTAFDRLALGRRRVVLTFGSTEEDLVLTCHCQAPVAGSSNAEYTMNCHWSVQIDVEERHKNNPKIGHLTPSTFQ